MTQQGRKPMRYEYEYEDIVGMRDNDIVALALQFGDLPIIFPLESILTVMATTRRVTLCDLLMSYGLSPDAHPAGKDSMELCIERDKDSECQMLKVLMKYSHYAISDQHSSGYTLLHTAVSSRNIDAAKYLISRGASMYDMDIDCTKVVDYDMTPSERSELLLYERNIRKL